MNLREGGKVKGRMVEMRGRGGRAGVEVTGKSKDWMARRRLENGIGEELKG